MRVLGLDAALGGFSAAVLDRDAVTAATSDRPDALEAGLARIAAVLARAGLALADVERLGVGIGPGSFTGVRIAVSYAKAIALARSLPLVGVSSFDVLTPAGAPDRVLAVVRGRPGIISARLRDGDRTAHGSGPIAEVLERLLTGLTGAELAVAGMTEDVHSAIAERGIVVRALSRRAENPAEAVARLALDGQPSPSLHAVAPDYGELPAVTIARPA